MVDVEENHRKGMFICRMDVEYEKVLRENDGYRREDFISIVSRWIICCKGWGTPCTPIEAIKISSPIKKNKIK